MVNIPWPISKGIVVAVRFRRTWNGKAILQAKRKLQRLTCIVSNTFDDCGETDWFDVDANDDTLIAEVILVMRMNGVSMSMCK